MTAHEAKMPRKMSNSPAALALRAAGYVKIPGWWVTKEQLELIEYVARQNKPHIDWIRNNAELPSVIGDDE